MLVRFDGDSVVFHAADVERVRWNGWLTPWFSHAQMAAVFDRIAWAHAQSGEPFSYSLTADRFTFVDAGETVTLKPEDGLYSLGAGWTFIEYVPPCKRCDFAAGHNMHYCATDLGCGHDCEGRGCPDLMTA